MILEAQRFYLFQKKSLFFCKPHIDTRHLMKRKEGGNKKIKKERQ